MPTPTRTHPLNDRERRLVAVAWRLAGKVLRDQCRIHRRVEDEIQSEFARRLVARIHTWDRSRCNLKSFAVTQVKHSVPAAYNSLRYDRTNEGHETGALDASVDAEALVAKPGFAGIDEYLVGLSTEQTVVIRMSLDGQGYREAAKELQVTEWSARKMLNESKRIIRQNIERASA